MSDLKNKHPDNIPGIYYVDKKCIGCRACSGIAPQFFKMNYSDNNAFVILQPINNEQINLCNKALKRCPVKAIGNDGYLITGILQNFNFKIIHLSDYFQQNISVFKTNNYSKSLFDIKI